LRQVKKSLKIKYHFPAIRQEEGDEYILEAELTAEVLGVKETTVHYSALKFYWRRATQLGYQTMALAVRLKRIPIQYCDDLENENIYECIRLLPWHG